MILEWWRRRRERIWRERRELVHELVAAELAGLTMPDGSPVYNRRKVDADLDLMRFKP